MTRFKTNHLACAAAFALTLAVPVSAMADVYHFAPTEAGAVNYPEHIGAVSAQQVATELDAARKDPNWTRVSRFGSPWPVANKAPKSRAQVNAELQTAMATPAWDSFSRFGAPWPNGQISNARNAQR